MVNNNKRGQDAEEDVERDERLWNADGKTKPAFNPKGIGSNVFLTAAAAVVPLVIVGVAGVKAILGARRLKR